MYKYSSRYENPSQEDFKKIILEVNGGDPITSVVIDYKEMIGAEVYFYEKHEIKTYKTMYIDEPHYRRFIRALYDLDLIKYKLTDNKIVKDGVALFQVQYLNGKMGGYIESEKNLAHSIGAIIDKNCYIYGDSTLVFGELNDCTLKNSGFIMIYDTTNITRVRQVTVDKETLTLIEDENKNVRIFGYMTCEVSEDNIVDSLINKYSKSIRYEVRPTVEPNVRVPVETESIYGEFISFNNLIVLSKNLINFWWKLGLYPKRKHLKRIKNLLLNSPDKMEVLRKEKLKKMNEVYLKRVENLDRLKVEFGNFDRWMNNRKKTN